MRSSSVWAAARGRRAAIVTLSGWLGTWSACASSNQLSEPALASAGSGGSAAAAGALGHAGAAGGSICTADGACASGGYQGPSLLAAGATSHLGGSESALAPNGICQPPALVAAGCAVDSGFETLCNGLDDDCDGSVDEGCPCDTGAVQPCFAGPPARRGVGACVDGSQTCRRGGEFAAYWSDCTGGIRPGRELCDGLDNDCNGCADDLDGCTPQFTCPGPNDARIPSGAPLTPYLLRGRDFFSGAASAWSWTIQGGPCDALTPTSPSFTVLGADAESATFMPKLSGDYAVTLSVTPVTGPHFSCTWIVHIVGPGLRIEMCYPESMTQDLDLYLKQPGHPTAWFSGPAQFSTALDQCSWANCEAYLRGDAVMPPQTVTRADWGYPRSALSLCENNQQGATWQSLGYCSSPRLDIDNNLSEATGVPENINVDAPKDSETFRIMVANFTGLEAHPLVNVYCDGRRTATVGAAPDALTGFTGSSGSVAIGALWRVADVTTHVTGNRTSCTVNVLHPPGSSTGFSVTVDDPRY